MIIDVHHHIVNEKGYVRKLIDEMDRLGIEKVCLIGLGKLFAKIFLTEGAGPYGCADNDTVQEAFENHPERVIGLAYVRPGVTEPAEVDEFHARGFKGLKIVLPKKDYDDESYFPIYEKAQARKMPILFHTGVLTLPEARPGEGVSSARMRPIFLDSIANEFPELNMIIAHCGIHWLEESAVMARIIPTIYVDISGKVDGWRKPKSIEFFRELFYWEEAYKKILFGSDVHYSELKETLADQKRIFEGVGFTGEKMDFVLAKNAQRIFNLPAE
jgi:predicted TIM-barrel fold metal-dependent hydrolase